MNADPTVLFEKLVSLFLMIAILVLIGLGTFYFKRRVSYLESAVKDQAQITQNVLGMLNTMIKSDVEDGNKSGARAGASAVKGSKKGNAPPFPRQTHLSTVGMEQGPFDFGRQGREASVVDVAVIDIDLGAMLAHGSLDANTNESPSIVEMDAPGVLSSPPISLSGGGSGKIVVSDCSDHEEAARREESESDIDSHEVDASVEAVATSNDEATADAQVAEGREENTDKETAEVEAEVEAVLDDIGLTINDAKSTYERLKVGELRDLLEKRGYADVVGQKYKHMKKAELIAALHSFEATPSSTPQEEPDQRDQRSKPENSAVVLEAN